MASLTSVIPVYNGEKFLPGALKMLAEQERPPDRIIVQDNCSTDATAQIASQSNVPNCEYHRNETNIGLINNLNRALDYASHTDYLHILPVDDRVEPPFFARLLPLLEGIPGRALAYAATDTVDEHGNWLNRRQSAPQGAWQELRVKTFLARQAELKNICCPAVVLKTNREEPPCRFRPDLPQTADVVFWAEWAKQCPRIIEVPEALGVHLHHSASGTNRHMSDVTYLRAFVLDEWKAMKIISLLIDENRVSRWVRHQKLKCLFAARSRVKVSLFMRSNREYADVTRREARALVSPLHWALGTLAVCFRDNLYALRGQEPEIYKLMKG
jgi:glycosyltransferase involved in cell wall biosynthesis